MDDCYMSVKNNWSKFIELLDITDKHNGILVINWHQRNFNEEEYPNHIGIYRKMIEEGIKRKAVFKTLSEFYYEIENLLIK
jgi:hypothetical protein